MRTLISGSGLLIGLVLTIAIHMIIINQNIRNTEVSNGLDMAMEVSMEQLASQYRQGIWDDNSQEQMINDFMSQLMENLANRIQSDGSVSAGLLYADLNKGIISVCVKEEFSYHLFGKSGICEKVRTYRFMDEL